MRGTSESRTHSRAARGRRSLSSLSPGGDVRRVRRRRGPRGFGSLTTGAPASRRWRCCSSDRAWPECRRRRSPRRGASLRRRASRGAGVKSANRILFGQGNSRRAAIRGEGISHKGAKLKQKAQRKAEFFFVPCSLPLRLCVKYSSVSPNRLALLQERLHTLV